MSTNLLNRRILVVDDNPAIHEDFRKILVRPPKLHDEFEDAMFGKAASGAPDGFDVDSAFQGRQGLDRICQSIAEKRLYSVVFMDVRMPPGWNGVETTARIWEEDPDVQVVICTAYSDCSWEEMLSRLGNSDRLVILKKPFDNIEVLQLAHSLTKKWQLLHDSRTQLADLFREVAARTAQVVEEKARFKDIFENSPVGIFQTTPDGKILCANPALTRLAGYDSPEDMINCLSDVGQGLYVDPQQRAKFLRVVEQDGLVRDSEVEWKLKGGQRKWVNVTAFAARDANGEVRHYEGFVYDISGRKSAEKERLELEIHLRHAQKMESIGQLAAGIAHEINTPAQYVGDNVRFLRDSFGSLQAVFKTHGELITALKTGCAAPDLVSNAEKAQQEADLDYCAHQIPVAIQETLEGMERICQIVCAMKDFSHPGDQHKMSADLNKAIETTVTVARNEWKYVADIKLDLDAALLPVPCYIGDFNQAVLNLIINSAQAIGEVVGPHGGSGKGLITICTRADGHHAEVRVTDTGAGIPDAVKPRIFEPFFTTKEVGKGTGQGLSIVYASIVKKHGGTLRFESKVGEGTTFVLRLPLASSSLAANRPVVQSAT